MRKEHDDPKFPLLFEKGENYFFEKENEGLIDLRIKKRIGANTIKKIILNE